MTPATRIAGLLATVEALDRQAQEYWMWLRRRIKANPETPAAGGPFPDEPPPVSLRSIELVETEIRQLNQLILRTTSVEAHLYEPYDVVGRRYHTTYDGPTDALFGNRTIHSLEHDYTGVRIWLDLVRTYLTYLTGAVRAGGKEEGDCSDPRPE
jgi:hypothetical protein